MDLSIAEDQTQGSHPTYQAIRKPALWWVTAVLLAGIIAIVLPVGRIRMLGLQLGGTIGSYTTNPPPAPQYAAISPGGSSITVYWSQVPAATSYSVYRSDKTYNGHPYPIGSGNSTSSGSFTDQDATSGGPYTYWVTASNGGGEGPGSPSLSATVNTPTLPAPAHGKLIVSGGSIKAYFSTVSGADSYNAYRDGWLMQTGVTSPYTDGGVPVGTSHWYTFGAVNSNGQGSMGPYYLSGTGGATPPVTTNLAATASNNSVQLSWNAVTDATGGSISYNLYRSSSAGGEGDIPVQNWISSNNSGPMSYTDTGLSPGVTYYYKVAAVSYAGGEGTLSNEASATPLTPLLPAPNLSGAPGDSSALLTWTTVAGASSYNVYRNNEYVPLGTSDNGKVPLVEVGASGTTYTDSGLTNGAWYYYSVNAVSSDGQGLGSQYVTVIPGSGSPTLAAHIVWTSDYTVTPNVQTGSTSGTVGGNTSVHLSLQVPPNLTSAVAKTVTIHEDAGDSPDVTATNVNFTVADSYTNYYQWSAVCGDPDPKKPGSPGMAYCDVSWSSNGAHQGKYTITINGQATIGNSFTPVTVTATIHVDREDLVITSTTPAYPAPLVVKTVDASGNPVALAPLPLSMAVTSASKMLVPATITIYDLNQAAIATINPVTPDPRYADGAFVGGAQSASGTTINYSWDGCYTHVAGQTPTPAPDGLYSYKCNVGGTSTTDATSTTSALSTPGNLSDTNISSSLKIAPSPNATVTDDGTTATYTLHYTVNDSHGHTPATGTAQVYDESLNLTTTLDLSQSNPADTPNPNGITLAAHIWRTSRASPPIAGLTSFDIGVSDGGANPDHVDKPALPAGETAMKFAAVMFAYNNANNTYFVDPHPSALTLYTQNFKNLGFGRLKNTPQVNLEPTAHLIQSAFAEVTPQGHSPLKLAIFDGEGSMDSTYLRLSGNDSTPSPTVLYWSRSHIADLFPVEGPPSKRLQTNAVCPADLLPGLQDVDLAICCGCWQGINIYPPVGHPDVSPMLIDGFFKPFDPNAGRGVTTALGVGAPYQANIGISVFLAGDQAINGLVQTDQFGTQTVYHSISIGLLGYLANGMTVSEATGQAAKDARVAVAAMIIGAGKNWPKGITADLKVSLLGSPTLKFK